MAPMIAMRLAPTRFAPSAVAKIDRQRQQRQHAERTSTTGTLLEAVAHAATMPPNTSGRPGKPAARCRPGRSRSSVAIR
jgi:hypothetical protein